MSKNDKLYPCCNTCKHKANNFYGCNVPKECFNGFSAYEQSEEMQNQEEAEGALNEI